MSKQGAAAPVPVDLVTYYTEAGMDYRAWSRNFNMRRKQVPAKRTDLAKE